MLPKDDVYDEVEPRIIHVNMQCNYYVLAWNESKTWSRIVLYVIIVIIYKHSLQ